MVDLNLINMIILLGSSKGENMPDIKKMAREFYDENKNEVFLRTHALIAEEFSEMLKQTQSFSLKDTGEIFALFYDIVLSEVEIEFS